MLKTGEYKTVNGSKACVLFIDEYGGSSGFSVLAGVKRAMSWDRRGEALGYNLKAYDLDLSPPTITIPETTLPEPMREPPEHMDGYYGLNREKAGWTVDHLSWAGGMVDQWILKTGSAHQTLEAAQQWADFFNKHLANK